MGLSIDVFGGAISIQDEMSAFSFFVTACHVIQCLDELGDTHTGSGSSGVEKLGKFHNLFVRKRGLMSLKKICQVIGIETKNAKCVFISYPSHETD